MMSFSDDKQADVIDAFNTTSRYLDDVIEVASTIFVLLICAIPAIKPCLYSLA